MLHDSILNLIGNTPLIKLNRVAKNLKCNLYAKCEFLNPGGSIKDRIAINMIEAAEKEGLIKPGDTLIEPTSGNTGIGLALASAVKGYRLIVTMPEKMSHEKQVVLEALGAQIIRTPTEAAWDHPDSHISVANRLQRELPNAHILDQYSNPNNPNTHYSTTAEELLSQLDQKIDMIVIGAGTGGTISGISKRLKEVNPECIVVGADPVGSILAGDDTIGSYKVEGIGYDFIPKVLEHKYIDKWVKTNDRQSFLLARQLILEEGLLCGGSSGAALSAALQEAQSLKQDMNCVIILADGVRNYLSKFIDDKWMQDNRFLSSDLGLGTVKDYLNFNNKQKIVAIEENQALACAMNIMRKNGFSQIPVTKNGVLTGLLDEKDVLEFLLSGKNNHHDTQVNLAMKRNVSTVNLSTPYRVLEEMLLKNQSAIIINEDSTPLRIITKIDLAEWIMHSKEKQNGITN